MKNGQGKPYILSPYPSFRDAFNALSIIIENEKERGRIFYVDNDFFDNKYPPNMQGRYFCIMQRSISDWEKYQSVISKSSKSREDNLLFFRQNF